MRPPIKTIVVTDKIGVVHEHKCNHYIYNPQNNSIELYKFLYGAMEVGRLRSGEKLTTRQSGIQLIATYHDFVGFEILPELEEKDADS